MNIVYACPNCAAVQRSSFDQSTRNLACTACGHSINTPTDALQTDAPPTDAPPTDALPADHLRHCLVCPSRDLYIRKDFPQRLGVALVVVGVVGSSIAWGYGNLWWTFGILFSTALIDVLLYALVGDALMCYRCGALYRGVAGMESHGQFDLETHEKYRQLAARMRSP